MSLAFKVSVSTFVLVDLVLVVDVFLVMIFVAADATDVTLLLLLLLDHSILHFLLILSINPHLYLIPLCI